MQFNTDFFLNFVFHPQAVLFQGLLLTIISAIVSQLIGTVLGIMLAMAGMSRLWILKAFNQLYIWFFRGTPVLVQLVLIYFGLPYLLGFDIFPAVMPLGTLQISGAVVAGIVSFGLHEAAYMSEITRAGIISIDSGQAEAAKALGMPPRLLMRRIILPQTIPVIVPALGNQFNNMLKTTALLSIIGVSEMFRVAEQLQAATFMTFEVYLGISIYYLLLTAGWTAIQMLLEKNLSRHLTAGSVKRRPGKSLHQLAELADER
ncbi:ABC transporter permease subunit [Enterobacteriales bacterium SAP-6]|uniref:ABC transporter permease subunit n=1 Tax=Acerihabitans arboris TaxID=2691583 RepID=A0A845SLH5_9GAMM|nr:ABC transporter permease subunit [Acerihabitans arboris]